MQAIEWSESFVTGHPLVDARHKELIDTCGDMAKYWVAGETAQCARLFSLCVALNEQHSREEKSVLENINSTNITAHLADHQEITDALEALHTNCRTYCAGRACLSEITHLIVAHILKHDLEIQNNFTDH